MAVANPASADIGIGPIGGFLGGVPSGGGSPHGHGHGSGGGGVAAGAAIGAAGLCVVIAGTTAAQGKWDKYKKRTTRKEEMAAISMCGVPFVGLVMAYQYGYRHLQWRKRHGLPLGVPGANTKEITCRAIGCR